MNAWKATGCRRTLRALAGLSVLALIATSRGRAADPPPAQPRITAVVPLAIPQGFSGTVRLRGVGLKAASAVRVEGEVQPSSLAIKETKEVPTPPGVEASVAGDSEVVADLVLSDKAQPDALSLVVAVGDQATAPVVLKIIPPTALVVGDPGTGFTDAKSIGPGQCVPGFIGKPREVDVYEVAAVAGRRLRVTVTSRAAASLLDPLLTLYDGSGRQLGVKDDISVDNRDAVLEVLPLADGTVYCVVQDALDTGSEWHSYLLEAAMAP